MSDIGGELARVRDAFDKPTLRLLDRKYSPLVLAVFRSSFSRDQRSVTAERLHAQVDTYLEELAAVGEGKLPPNASGCSLCVSWMNDQWLFRTIGDSGAEEYSLTSHALEALDLVATLARERALISESRINTIIDATTNGLRGLCKSLLEEVQAGSGPSASAAAIRALSSTSAGVLNPSVSRGLRFSFAAISSSSG